MIITSVLAALLLVVCVFLIFLVLSQDVKGGGLAGALSGGAVQSAFGGRSAESITKLTAWVAAIFFVLIIAIGLLSSRASRVGLTGGAEDKTPSAPTSTPK
jgi:preprotein translocase subunit SecG